MASEISTARPEDGAILSGTASVLIPLALPKPYDYKVPPGMAVHAGSYVVVPLGTQETVGVVWGEGSGEVGHNRLKAISDVIGAPPMPGVLRRFIDWVAGYTVSPAGSVLRLAIRAPGALEPPRMRTAYRLGNARPSRMTPARRRVIEVAGDGFARTIRELGEEAGVSDGVVRGLVEAEALVPVGIPAEAPFPDPLAGVKAISLSAEQGEAAVHLVAAVEAQKFSATLLDGVTGSGKTEVYFEAVAAALAQGKQVLILLPEIALTSQFLERFERRFGCRPAEWHSGLPSRERRRVWRGVAEGRARVVAGARSALILPYCELEIGRAHV